MVGVVSLSRGRLVLLGVGYEQHGEVLVGGRTEEVVVMVGALLPLADLGQANRSNHLGREFTMFLCLVVRERALPQRAVLVQVRVGEAVHAGDRVVGVA